MAIVCRHRNKLACTDALAQRGLPQHMRMKSGEFYTVQDGMCGVPPSEPTEIPLGKCIQVIRNATMLDLTPIFFDLLRDFQDGI